MEENIRQTLEEVGTGKDFGKGISIAWEINPITDRTARNFKSLCTMKQSAEWRKPTENKTFADYTSDGGLAWRIYGEL